MTGTYNFFRISDMLSLYWSVAPSIFNIKERGLAHCLLWSLGKIGSRQSIRTGCIIIKHGIYGVLRAFQQQSPQRLVDEYGHTIL